MFIFHAGSRRLGSKNFRNRSYLGKTAGLAHLSVSDDYGGTDFQIETNLINIIIKIIFGKNYLSKNLY